MENIFWILAAVVVVGMVIWYLTGKKKELTPSAKEPEEPEETTPPETPEAPTT